MTSLPRLVALAMLTALVMTPASAADGEPPKPLFQDDAWLDLTLYGPWRELAARHQRNDDSYDAELRWTEDGVARAVPAKVKARGLTRRYKICDFPPLSLKVDEEAARGTLFEGQPKIKLVSWCARGDRYQDYNLLEYAAYRIYRTLTPYSFAVRGLDANWDDERRGGDRQAFSFLIEDVDEMAERLGLKEVDIHEIEPQRLDPETTARYALFQFLIGNLDWAALGGPGQEYCCHNGKLIGTSEDAETLYTVPYDFDSAGLVNAHYAAPPEGLDARRVTDRLYRGFCAHNDALPGARADVLAQEAEIMSIIDGLEGLGNRAGRRARDYLQEGFEILRDDAEFAEQVVAACRG